MFEKLEVGSNVIYTDEHFADHVALVTAIWGQPDWREHCIEPNQACVPCINLVYVSGDNTKDDPYGRQIERSTSVVHASSQPAGGACWRMSEEPRPKMGVVEK